jgi:hypothetical protein
MHLLGKAQLVLPEWEPDQGWRVLDPDGHVVDAGGKTIIHVELTFTHEFTREFGVDGNRVPLLRQVS